MLPALHQQRQYSHLSVCPYFVILQEPWKKSNSTALSAAPSLAPHASGLGDPLASDPRFSLLLLGDPARDRGDAAQDQGLPATPLVPPRSSLTPT